MTPGVLREIWMKVQEPRSQTVLQTLIYVLFLLSGVGVLIDPPMSIEGAVGTYSTAIWGSFALLGGLLGAYGTPGGRWLVERPAIWLCGTAVIIYLSILGYLQFSRSGNRLIQICFVSIALFHLIKRYRSIKKYDYEPGK